MLDFKTNRKYDHRIHWMTFYQQFWNHLTGVSVSQTQELAADQLYEQEQVFSKPNVLIFGNQQDIK